MSKADDIRTFIFAMLALVIIVGYIRYTQDVSTLQVDKAKLQSTLTKVQANMSFCEKRIDRFDMYYNNTYGYTYSLKYNSTYPNGINFGKWFAVWTDGRSYSDVIETCNHEWAHSKFGKEHFCGLE